MKRQVLGLLLAFALLFALVACNGESAQPAGGGNTDERVAQGGATGTDDDDEAFEVRDGVGDGSITFYDSEGNSLAADELGGYVHVGPTIQIGGVNVTLPAPLAEAMAPLDVDWVWISSPKTPEWDELGGMLLDGGDYESMTVYTHDNQAFDIEVENNTSQALPYYDCLLTGWSDRLGESYDSTYLRIFDGQVYLGMSQDEFVAVVGESHIQQEFPSLRFTSYDLPDDYSVFYNLEFEDEVLVRIGISVVGGPD